MTLAALDINADRLTVLAGQAGQTPYSLALDGDGAELPLALLFEKRTIEIGRAALALCRKSPHLVCKDFLPKVGEPDEWGHGRHHVTASQALSLVFKRVKENLDDASGVTLSLPGYLSRAQVSQVVELAENAGLPIAGGVTRTLAAGLVSFAEHPWHNAGIFIDVDNHAMTCNLLRPNETELESLGQRVLTGLSLRAWREKVLGRIADLCVRLSRRDPRESPEAEQTLFDQMDMILDRCSQNQPVALHIQAMQWFQALTLQPQEAVTACAALARQAAEEVRAALKWVEEQMTSATIYLTAAAAPLPGLAAAIYRHCDNKAPVVLLSSAATVQPAFELAARIQQDDLAPGFYAQKAPLSIMDGGDLLPLLPFPKEKKWAARK